MVLVVAVVVAMVVVVEMTAVHVVARVVDKEVVVCGNDCYMTHIHDIRYISITINEKLYGMKAVIFAGGGCVLEIVD